MAVDMSQFHRVFFEESFEGLQIMEQSLLDIDCDSPDRDSVDAIFRAAHSIKGSSATFGFAVVAEFTHHLETLLDQWRDGQRRIIREDVDTLLQAVDALRYLLTELQAGHAPDVNVIQPVAQRIHAVLQGSGMAATAGAPTTAVPGGDGWIVTFVPGSQVLQTGNEPLRMFRELAELGKVSATPDLAALPDFSELDPETCYVRWRLELQGAVEESRVREVFEWVIDDCDIAFEALNASAPQTEPPAPAVSAAADPTPAPHLHDTAVHKAADDTKIPRNADASSVRVSIDKIDSLVNLVGELVITQSMLSQLSIDFDPSRLPRLQEGLVQLEHNTRELQESVMRIRMLPISLSFSRFPRMVRDLSRQLDKKVELKLSGEQTELDKTVMEKIGDPLVHLIRNALDHGLETPGERIAAGKPETGHIHLSASHQSGSIVIEISDDGRGLNTEKIREKAVAQGLIRDSDVLSEQEINELIFQPGFSTAEKLTDVSGRGVGMDVVRRNIEALNGSIEVASQRGAGSRIAIRLPLTLAILDGQLIQVGQQIYIIPLTSIIESLQPDLKLINRVAGGCDLLRLRHEYIPIIKLHEVFDVEPLSTDLSQCLLVVVEAGTEKVAIVVDDLLGQQQVVIKSMEANYRKVEGISGATILGDGKVSLILEITDLVRMAGIRHQARISSKRVANKERMT